MQSSGLRRIRVVDSHTAGEPTRVIVEGGPALNAGSVAAQLEQLRGEFDAYRSAVVNEPRGSEVLVGALLCRPADPSCSAGVMFFNNIGYLGMCGHGTIGLLATLAYLGRIEAGEHRLETPVGIVSARLAESGEVTLDNVPSYRQARGVVVEVPGIGRVAGDVAWGGNWFFLTDSCGIEIDLAEAPRLSDVASRIRQAVNSQGFPAVDHVELFGPPRTPGANARSFVLCPGGAYDRSPCGTGTSAKLACLAADGKLAEGEPWVQESILGSTFRATYRCDGERILPQITGRAFITAESTLLLDERDPYCWGIRPASPSR